MCTSLTREKICEIVDALPGFPQVVKTKFKNRVLPAYDTVGEMLNADQKQYAATHRHMCGKDCMRLWDAVRETVYARNVEAEIAESRERAEAALAAERAEAEHKRRFYTLAEVKALAGMMELCGIAEMDIERIKEFFLSAKVDIGRMENSK